MTKRAWSLVLLYSCCMLLSLSISAQNGIRIGNGAAVAENGVLLELESSTQGLLIPRINALTDITAPVEGLLVYRRTSPVGFYYYDGALWRPWHKPIAGTVNMTNLGSTIERGEGYTVTHSGVGSDVVLMDMGFQAPPIVTVSSSVISGLPPAFPQDYCPQNTSSCSVYKVNALLLDYQNNGSVEFITGVSGCNPASGNRTSYDLSSSFWQVAPPTMLPGQDIRVSFQVTASTHAASIWADWNQDGSFDDSERVYADLASSGVLTRNAVFAIPAGACAGTTAIRITVTNQYDQILGCEIPNTTPGETEEIEVIIGGSAACVYQERQTSCNVSAVLTNQFRVECSDLGGTPVNTRYYFKVTENY